MLPFAARLGEEEEEEAVEPESQRIWGRLVAVSTNKGENDEPQHPQQIELTGDAYVFGRGKHCDVQLTDPCISTVH